MRRPMALILIVPAAAAVAAPASAANYGRLLGHAKASGGAHATDIGWGPRLRRSAKKPRSFTVVVKGTLKPGYFCQLSYCRDVNVHWYVACSKPGLVRSRQGGMFGRPPRLGRPQLPFKNPRGCTVHVEAHPNSYVGGTIEIWLHNS